MSAPSFLLTREPWIDVRDSETHTYSKVGIRDALLHAHRLTLPVGRADEIPLLRLLAAVYDAAAGPRDTAEWDAAWAAPTLDTDRITAYLDRWEHRLDLLHPTNPAFQCGQLDGAGAYNCGAEALNPTGLGGSSAAWFDHRLSQAEHPPCPHGQAAAALLFVLAYDVSGIKRAAPGDPAGTGNKLYGSFIGLTASVTHVHIETGRSLKDTLLLALPPQPRAEGDAPVWERDTPPAAMRLRQPTGRLDVLTWPSRRIRLRPDADGLVHRVALYDGDRIPDRAQTYRILSALDPMTGWGTTAKGDPAPRPITDNQAVTVPWAAASLLREDATSPVLGHVIQAAERGALDPGLPLRVVMSTTEHTNKHRTAISAQPLLSTRFGTAGALARPDVRDALARAAGTPWALRNHMVRAALEVMGGFGNRDMLTAKIRMWDLEGEWDNTVQLAATDPDAARTQWWKTVDRMIEERLEEVPLSLMKREQARALYRKARDKAPAKRAQPAPRRARDEAPARHEPAPRQGEAPAARKQSARRPSGRSGGGRPTQTYEVFGGSYSLSQISRMPQCQVSYPTLRKRVEEEGWDVEEAATTPTRRGPKPRQDTP